MKSTRTGGARLGRQTQAGADAAAESDTDNPPLTDDEIARLKVVVPAKKVPISIRVDEPVLEWFRAQGPGYQSRMVIAGRSRDRSAAELATARLQDLATSVEQNGGRRQIYGDVLIRGLEAISACSPSNDEQPQVADCNRWRRDFRSAWKRYQGLGLVPR